jgi:hypothetical protein
MMIVLSHANITDTAVLASGGLKEKASTAEVPRLIQYVVVRVPSHFMLMVVRSDD